VTDAGEGLLRGMTSVPADQRWFWEPDWQAGEREASEQIKAGDVEVFEEVDAHRWRPELRIKRVQGVPKGFEMTWAPDGRAPWQFGAPIRDGVRHEIWRRVGTHDIFADA
jgi:hypothetical protein